MGVVDKWLPGAGGGGGAILGVGVLFDDDSIPANSSLKADITQAAGSGVAIVQFTTTGTPADTFHGFSVGPGTYHCALSSTTAGGSSVDLFIRSGLAFPTTGATIRSAGTLDGIECRVLHALSRRPDPGHGKLADLGLRHERSCRRAQP